MTALDNLEVRVRGISLEQIHNLETMSFVAPIGAMILEEDIRGDGTTGQVSEVFFPLTRKPTPNEMRSLTAFAPFDLILIETGVPISPFLKASASAGA
jgi:hypothetical protein